VPRPPGTQLKHPARQHLQLLQRGTPFRLKAQRGVAVAEPSSPCPAVLGPSTRLSTPFDTACPRVPPGVTTRQHGHLALPPGPRGRWASPSGRGVGPKAGGVRGRPGCALDEILAPGARETRAGMLAPDGQWPCPRPDHHPVSPPPPATNNRLREAGYSTACSVLLPGLPPAACQSPLPFPRPAVPGSPPACPGRPLEGPLARPGQPDDPGSSHPLQARLRPSQAPPADFPDGSPGGLWARPAPTSTRLGHANPSEWGRRSSSRTPPFCFRAGCPPFHAGGPRMPRLATWHSGILTGRARAAGGRYLFSHGPSSGRLGQVVPGEQFRLPGCQGATMPAVSGAPSRLAIGWHLDCEHRRASPVVTGAYHPSRAEGASRTGGPGRRATGCRARGRQT
jgi:hypothetical protein